jgi:hypothetical protein
MSAPTSESTSKETPAAAPEDENISRATVIRRLIGGILVFALVVLLGYLLFPGVYGYVLYKPRHGDVLFQSLPDNPLARAIEGATHCPFSHCGIVSYENGDWYVYEALDKVQRVPLRVFCSRGRGQAFAAYRIPDFERSLLPRTMDCVRQMLGRPNDEHFRMEDDSLYASELIYHAFKTASTHQVGELVKFGDLNWQPYRETFEKAEGGPIDLNREVIFPAQMIQSPELNEVYRFGFPAPPPKKTPEPPK